MGLDYKPRVRVSGSGESVINEGLVSWGRVDSSGVRSDQLTIVVDVFGKNGLPREGAVLSWFEGYDDLVDKGEFRITRIVPRLFPPTITIIATAAPFQVDDKTGFKERRTRTFESVVFADMFRQIVGHHGFSPRIASEFEGLVIDHVDQVDETDSSFLARIASGYDAIAKPVNGVYVLAKKGMVKTVSGLDIPPVVVSVSKNDPSDLSRFINCQVDSPSRTKKRGVKASWLDNSTGSEFEVEDGIAPFKRLRQSYSSEDSALAACRDELRKIEREGVVVRMDLPGDPYLVAEGLLKLDDSFPSYMSGDWSIDKVEARGDGAAGYRCSVVATQPDRQ